MSVEVIIGLDCEYPSVFWNEKGKVCDRRVEFVTKDHKYSTTGASAAYAEVKDKVLALDELLGTPIIAGMVSFGPEAAAIRPGL